MSIKSVFCNLFMSSTPFPLDVDDIKNYLDKKNENREIARIFMDLHYDDYVETLKKRFDQCLIDHDSTTGDTLIDATRAEVKRTRESFNWNVTAVGYRLNIVSSYLYSQMKEPITEAKCIDLTLRPSFSFHDAKLNKEYLKIHIGCIPDGDEGFKMTWYQDRVENSDVPDGFIERGVIDIEDMYAKDIVFCSWDTPYGAKTYKFLVPAGVGTQFYDEIMYELKNIN